MIYITVLIEIDIQMFQLMNTRYNSTYSLTWRRYSTKAIMILVFLLILPTISNSTLLFNGSNQQQTTDNGKTGNTNPNNNLPNSAGEFPTTSDQSVGDSGSTSDPNTSGNQVSSSPSTTPKIHYEPPTYPLVTTGAIDIKFNDIPNLASGQIEIYSMNQKMELDTLVLKLDNLQQTHLYAEVPQGLYQVNAIFDSIQHSDPIYVQVGHTYNAEFVFNTIDLNFYDFSAQSPSQLVSLINSKGDIMNC